MRRRVRERDARARAARVASTARARDARGRRRRGLGIGIGIGIGAGGVARARRPARRRREAHDAATDARGDAHGRGGDEEREGAPKAARVGAGRAGVSRAGAGAAGRFGDARERGREGKIPVRRGIRVREGDVRDGGRWWRSRRRWSGKSDGCGWKTCWSIEAFRVAADSRGRVRRGEYLGGVSDDGGAGDRVRVDRELEGAVVQGEREDVGRGAEVAARGAV